MHLHYNTSLCYLFSMEKGKDEVNKLHNATEEERFKYFKQNPKEVVNKAHKGFTSLYQLY